VPKQLPSDDNVGRMQFLLALRRRGISEPAVLRAMDEVPREHFVDSPFAESAYADQALPIACGQTISQPYVVAYMTEQLGVQADHRVLEVGTGSGYQSAYLSHLTDQVYTIEIIKKNQKISPIPFMGSALLSPWPGCFIMATWISKAQRKTAY